MGVIGQLAVNILTSPVSSAKPGKVFTLLYLCDGHQRAGWVLVTVVSNHEHEHVTFISNFRMSRPIIVVTGANSGVGFGICHRLLLQLSRRDSPDAQPFLSPNRKQDGDSGLTIIMACRSTKRAEVARTELYGLLDADIENQKHEPGYNGYAEAFRNNLKIDIQFLDLAVMQSIFQFGDELFSKYSYVSHLICNAGVASFAGLNRMALIQELLSNPMKAVSNPTYYRQQKGELSPDGLGWIWQCNVFGHYVLFRTLEPLLQASTSSLGSRVLWISSMQAFSNFYSRDDWQLVKSENAYQSSKYQMELISTLLDRAALQAPASSRKPRHFIIDPGAIQTKFHAKLRNFFTTILALMLFYLVRLFGSPHHTITSYKAAVSAVQISIVPFDLLPVFGVLFTGSPERRLPVNSNPGEPDVRPKRYCSVTDRWGHETVRVNGVSSWEDNEETAVMLLKQCESLYESWLGGVRS